MEEGLIKITPPQRSTPTQIFIYFMYLDNITTGIGPSPPVGEGYITPAVILKSQDGGNTIEISYERGCSKKFRPEIESYLHSLFQHGFTIDWEEPIGMKIQ
jgi:hypothetical protein